MALIERDKSLLEEPLKVVQGDAPVGKGLLPARILGGVVTATSLSCAVMLPECCLP